MKIVCKARVFKNGNISLEKVAPPKEWVKAVAIMTIKMQPFFK